MTETITLQAHIDSGAVQTLATSILQHKGKPIEIDASEVSFLGALGVQVLVAAHRQWQHDEVAFGISQTNEAFWKACESLGISPEDLPAQPAAQSSEDATE